MIREIAEKLLKTKNKLSKDKGEINLFGLFKRADLVNEWDMIFSAPWLSDDKQKDLVYIIDKMKEDLNGEDLRLIYRIVLLKPSEDIIKKLTDKFVNIDNIVEEENVQANGYRLKHIFLIASKSLSK